MAFVNERLPEEERRTFNLGYGRKKTPKYVTIDKEKDYCKIGIRGIVTV